MGGFYPNPSSLPIDWEASPELLDSLKWGARRHVATTFWRGMHRNTDARTVHDPCCGSGSELYWIRNRGFHVSGHDPDPDAKKGFDELVEHGLLNEDYWKMNHAAHISFVNFDWAGMDRETFSLHITDLEFFTDMMLLGDLRKAHYTVMKLPKNVTFDFGMHDFPPKPVPFFVSDTSKTGYMLFPHTKHAFDESQRLQIPGMEKKWICSPKKQDNGEASSSSGSNWYWTTGPDGEPFKSTKVQTMTQDELMTYLGKGRDMVVSLMGTLGSWIQQNVSKKVKTQLGEFGKHFTQSAAGPFQGVLDVLRATTAPKWEVEHFHQWCESHDFEKWLRLLDVTVGADQGKGFVSGKHLIVPFHVSHGKPLVVAGRKIYCASMHEKEDYCAYGFEDDFTFSKAVLGDTVFAETPSGRISGKVVTVEPFRALFKGGPVHGLSGSPIVNGSGVPVSIYATHFLQKGSYLSGPSQDDWTSNVVEELSKNDHVLLSVPCGMGKTTKNIVALSNFYSKIIVIEPRVMIVRETGAYVKRLLKKKRVITCAEEDDLPEKQFDVLFISHGKFIANWQALKGKHPTLVVMDEAHDSAGLSMAARAICDVKFDCKFLEMTATPDDPKFLSATLGVSKFPVAVKVEEPVIEGDNWYTEFEVAERLEKMENRRVLVQIPSKRFYEKVVGRQDPSKKYRWMLLTSETRKNMEPGNVAKFLADPGVVFATNTANFGVTFPVDTIIVQGSVYKMRGEEGEAQYADRQPLSQAEMNQWVGRVGRVRPGTAIIPHKGHGTECTMGDDDQFVYESFGLIHGLPVRFPKRRKTLTKYSLPRLVTAMKLPGNLLHSLGLVDDEGCALSCGGSGFAWCQENKVPNKFANPLPSKLYEQGRDKVKGPSTGFDPSFPIDWNTEMFGDPVKTGLMSFLWSCAMTSTLSWSLLKCLRSLSPGMVTEGDCVNLEKLLTSAPEFKELKDPNVRIGPISGHQLHTAIQTMSLDGFTEWVTSYLETLLSAFGFLTARCEGVVIHHNLKNGAVAQALTYYIQTQGYVGEFRLNESVNRKGVALFPSAGEFYTDHGVTDVGYAEVDRILAPQKVETSLFYIPTLLCCLHGFAGIALHLLWTVGSYSREYFRDYIDQWLGSAERLNYNDLKNSYLGRKVFTSEIMFTAGLVSILSSWWHSIPLLASSALIWVAEYLHKFGLRIPVSIGGIVVRPAIAPTLMSKVAKVAAVVGVVCGSLGLGVVGASVASGPTIILSAGLMILGLFVKKIGTCGAFMLTGVALKAIWNDIFDSKRRGYLASAALKMCLINQVETECGKVTLVEHGGGQGSCLFRVLAHSLFNGSMTWQEVKRDVVEEYNKTPFVIAGDESSEQKPSVQEFFNSLSVSQVWDDWLDAYLSRKGRYLVRISPHPKTGDWEVAKFGTQGRPLFVAQHSGHFQEFVPESEEEFLLATNDLPIVREWMRGEAWACEMGNSDSSEDFVFNENAGHGVAVREREPPVTRWNDFLRTPGILSDNLFHILSTGEDTDDDSRHSLDFDYERKVNTGRLRFVDSALEWLLLQRSVKGTWLVAHILKKQLKFGLTCAFCFGLMHWINPVYCWPVGVAAVGFAGAALLLKNQLGQGDGTEYDIHCAFRESEFKMKKTELELKTVPYVGEKTLVLGVAGEKEWFDQMIARVRMLADTSDSALIISDRELTEDEIHRMEINCPVRFSVVVVPTSSPEEIRSWRLLPVLYGHESTNYRIRDVDWIPGNIEKVMDLVSKHEPIVGGNNLQVSAGPFLLGLTNIQGGAINCLREKWKNTRYAWKLYGHDECLLNSLQDFAMVVGKMNTSEQLFFWNSTTQKTHSEVRLYVSSQYFAFPGFDDRAARGSLRMVKLQSWGDSRWLLGLHRACASEHTICHMKPDETFLYDCQKMRLMVPNEVGAIKTSISEMSIGVIEGMEFMYCRLVSMLERKGYSKVVKTLNAGIGFLIGICGSANSLLLAVSNGEELANEEGKQVKDGQMLAAVRRLGGTELYKPTKSTRADIVKMALSWVANPVGAAVGTLYGLGMGMKVSEMAYSGALFFSGSFPLWVAGFLNSFRYEVPYYQETTTYLCSSAVLLHGLPIFTAPVPIFYYDGKLKMLGEWAMPWINKSSTYVKQFFTRGAERSWVTYDDTSLCHYHFPAAMVSSRASDLMFLVKNGFVRLEKNMNISVLGSGKGGIAQGLLVSGLRNSHLQLVTLPESGWVTAPIVEAHAKYQGVVIENVERDMHEVSICNDFVICDCDPFLDFSLIKTVGWEISDQWFLKQDLDWRKACLSVKIGGTLLIATHSFPLYRVRKCAFEVSFFFKEVTIVASPVSNRPGKFWIIGKGRRRVKYLPYAIREPSSYRYYCQCAEAEEAYFDYYDTSKKYAMIWHDLIHNNEQGMPWMAYLHTHFRVPTRSVDNLVYPRLSVHWWSQNPHLSKKVREFYETAPLMIRSSAFKRISKGLVPCEGLTRSSGVQAIGMFPVPPVPDREFNTSLDLVSAAVVCQEEVLGAIGEFEIPPQNNFYVVAGLISRYCFAPHHGYSPELEKAYSLLLEFSVPLAKGFDFRPLCLEEAWEVVNRKSTCGYNSRVESHKIGALITNEPEAVEREFRVLVEGGDQDRSFHGYPKVEKKQVKETVSAPRIFTYLTGEVRVAELMMTYNMNQFLGAFKGILTSASGSMAWRARKLATAWVRFANPAALEAESSKWDGHKTPDMHMFGRLFMITCARSGKNGEIFARFAHSTAAHDCVGFTELVSGLVIENLRGNQKSGSWDTSTNNKVVNSMIFVAAAIRAGVVNTLEDLIHRIFLLIEGDDGIVIGEDDDISAIAAVRDDVYSECGFPQKNPPNVKRRLYETDFCSHGVSVDAKSLTPVSVRPADVLFGRFIVSLANNDYAINLKALARTLSSGISMVAVFWAIPECRAVFDAIRELVPASVVPASQLPDFRWKEKFLCIGDYTKFEALKYVNEQYELDLKSLDDCDIESDAREFLGFNSFRSLVTTDLVGNTLKTLEYVDSPVSEEFPNRVWYSKEVTLEMVLEDLPWLMSHRIGGILFETSLQLRDAIKRSCLRNSLNIRWMSAESAIAKCPHDGHIILVTARDALATQFLLKQKFQNPKNARKLGFRGTDIIVYAGPVKTSPICWTVSGVVAASCLALWGVITWWCRAPKKTINFDGGFSSFLGNEMMIPPNPTHLTGPQVSLSGSPGSSGVYPCVSTIDMSPSITVQSEKFGAAKCLDTKFLCDPMKRRLKIPPVLIGPAISAYDHFYTHAFSRFHYLSSKQLPSWDNTEDLVKAPFTLERFKRFQEEIPLWDETVNQIAHNVYNPPPKGDDMVSSVMGYKIVGSASKIRLMDLTKPRFCHGHAYEFPSPSIHVHQVNVDHGCGVSCFVIPKSFVSVVRQRMPLLLSGTHRQTSVSAGTIALLRERFSWDDEEISRFAPLLGTLGGGNHFVEVEENRGVHLLVIHSGSRGLLQHKIKDHGYKPNDQIDDILMHCLRECETFAGLNRSLIAGFVLGLNELCQCIEPTIESVHTKVVKDNVFNTTITKNLCTPVGNGVTVLLGSPECGIAFVKAYSQLVPHGIAGDGGPDAFHSLREDCVWRPIYSSKKDPRVGLAKESSPLGDRELTLSAAFYRH